MEEMLQVVSLFQKLHEIAKLELGDLFYSVGRVSENVSKICEDIRYVLGVLIEQPQSFDLSEESCFQFLTSTLPVFVETFIKRQSRYSNEDDIYSMFNIVARLLALPASQEIAQLCELRNMLLVNQYHGKFKFIDPKQLKSTLKHPVPPGHLVENFFVTFGRPSISIKNGKYYHFWPDEWEKVLGGFKAVGHYIRIQITGTELRQGFIIDYVPEKDMYTIKFDDVMSTNDYTSKDIMADNVFNFSLKSVKHQWADIYNRNRLVNNQVNSPQVMSKSNEISNELKLTFTASDEGIYLRIYWAKYKKYFYGRILVYNVSTRLHSVIYEDGELKDYDLSCKEFEVVVPPAEVLPLLRSAESEVRKAQIVSEWHRNLLLSKEEDRLRNKSLVISDNTSIPQTLQIDSNSTLNMSTESAVALRPDPSIHTNVSMYHVMLINTFFNEGGQESLFQSYSDSSTMAPPCSIIYLHLELIYALKVVVRASVFRGLVWEAKECIPGSFHRYEEYQIKELTSQLLNDTLGLLKDLVFMSIALANSSASTSTPMNLRDSLSRSNFTGDSELVPPSPTVIAKVLETFDVLRLSMALKLLKCSQLQKRYLGLSMMKEIIDITAPRVSQFVSRRQTTLSATHNSNSSINRQQQNTTYNQVDQNRYKYQNSMYKSSISNAQIEQWLLENCVVEELFGSSLHQDLVAKSDVLLVFLAHRRAVTKTQISALWQSARGAHEAVVRVIHQLILLIVPVLEPNIRLYLFDLMAAVPYKDYTEQILVLLKNYTVQTLITFRDEAAGKSFVRLGATGNTPTESGSASSISPRISEGGSTTSDNKQTQSESNGKIAGMLRKGGQVVAASQRLYLGFNVLWQYIQDPISGDDNDIVDEGLVDKSIQLLVELLQDEFSDERETILEKCVDNIQMGVSVPVSLQLIRKILALYPMPSKGWFATRANNPKIATISSQIDKLLKQNHILDLFFVDLARYQRAIFDELAIPTLLPQMPQFGMKSTSPKSRAGNLILKADFGLEHPSLKRSPSMNSSEIPNSNWNDYRFGVSGKTGRTTHLKGISERLEFLKFIILKSTSTLTESQTTLLWKVLGEGALTVETLDKYVDWMNEMFHRENKVFAALVTTLANESDALDPSLPSKLFFLQNVSYLLASPVNSGNTTVGSDVDASEIVEHLQVFEENILASLFQNNVVAWATHPDSIALVSRPTVASFCLKLFFLANINNRAIRVDIDNSWQRTGQLHGLGVLWRMAVDSSEKQVADAAVTLIVELHHRMPVKFRGNEIIRGYLLRRCFKQLSISIQSLRMGDAPPVSELIVSSSGKNLLATSDDNIGILGSDLMPTRASEITAGQQSVSTSQNRSVNGTQSALSQSSSVASNVSRHLNTSTNVQLQNPQPDYESATRAGPQSNYNPDANVAASDDWFDDFGRLLDPVVVSRRISRLIVVLRLFIQRFHKFPVQLYKIQVLSARDETTPIMTLTMKASDTIGLMKKKISDHFKENADTIALMKQGKQSQLLSLGLSNVEHFDRDDITLRQAKFLPNDTIIARKKENSKPVDPERTQSQAPSGHNFEDTIKPEDLDGEIFADSKPLTWIPIDSNPPTFDKQSDMKESPLFTFPSLPTPPHIDMTLCSEYADKSTGSERVSDNANKLFEYLGSYLKSSPEYIDQLLEMLDGYLSAEAFAKDMNSSSNNELDLSAAVWDVLQSLPTHPNLMKQIRNLGKDSKGAHLNRLLDHNCPYRLLYTLQIMDAFLAGDNDLRMGTTPKVISKRIFEWTMKFINDGGIEKILTLLSAIGKRLLDIESKPVSTPGVGILSIRKSGDRSMDGLNGGGIGVKQPKEWGSVSRVDVDVMSICMLNRLLHRFLLFDPVYSCWQRDRGNPVDSKSAKAIALESSSLSPSNVPNGLVLSILQGKSLVGQTIELVYALSDLHSRHQISSSSLKAVAENSLLLLFGLLTAFDDGLVLLQAFSKKASSSSLLKLLNSSGTDLDVVTSDGKTMKKPTLEQWLRALCLQMSDPFVRSGVCRRILEGCISIWKFCSDAENGPPPDKKSSRIALFHYVFESLILAVNEKMPSLATFPLHFSNTVEQEGNLTSTIDVTENRFAYPEQLYSLVAVLIGLIASPNLILGSAISTQLNTFLDSELRDNKLLSQVEGLCFIFIDKLLSHQSTESFNSNQSDGSLVGILRVLLVLSTGNTEWKNNMCQYSKSSYTRRFGAQIYTTGRVDSGDELSQPQDLISYLFHACLFPRNLESPGLSNATIDSAKLTSQGAICQTKYTRSLVYYLLYQMCHNNTSNMSRLVAVMNSDADEHSITSSTSKSAATIPSPNSPPLPFITSNKLRNQPLHWGYDPNSLIKDTGASVGLANQGGTCYMNALLQQLYHTPAFANGLLQIETMDTDDDLTDLSAEGYDALTNKMKDRAENETVLFQLQVLFAFLRVSQKRYYDTLPFCQVLKDYDGQPISLGEQKDINEFAGMLFDKLESNPEAAKLLSETIQGQIVWQTRSTETPYRSEREEKFYMVTAEVKNKATLEESLELFVADEFFSGENKLEDPVAGRKVEALRRCAIRTLPPTLIIHLKRFEFDLETMDRKKVNDKITFPMNLNMFPYTEEGIAMKDAKLKSKTDIDGESFDDDENENGSGKSNVQNDVTLKPSANLSATIKHSNYYQYTLKGVVAHVGAIDRGHYYSFIKDSYNTTDDTWYEFNDRSVLPFSLDALPSECFGGEEKYTNSNGATAVRVRQNNAYLLFYERANDPDEAVSISYNAQRSATNTPAPQLRNNNFSFSSISNTNIDKFSLQPESTSTQEASIENDENNSAALSSLFQVEPTQPSNALSPPGQYFQEPNSPESYYQHNPKFIQNNRQWEMSSKVLQAVWWENLSFQTDRCLYDPMHFKFMWQLLKSPLISDILLEDLSDTSNQDKSSSESTTLNKYTLSQLVVLATRFNVEVVARARAKSCVMMFFERLEDILLADKSRCIAETLVTELAKDCSTSNRTQGNETYHSLPRSTPASRSASVDIRQTMTPGKPSAAPQASRSYMIEFNFIQKRCHHWLYQIFLQCPVTSTVRGWRRFLYTCFKVLKPLHSNQYFLRSQSFDTLTSTATPMDQTTSSPTKDSISASQRLNSPSKLRRESGADSPYIQTSAPLGSDYKIIEGNRYSSCVSRLLNKILILTEKIPPEYIYGREGYRHLIGLLQQVAYLGFDEKRLLVEIGAIYRIVCSLLLINPSVNGIPKAEISTSIELITTLVRSSFIPSSDSFTQDSPSPILSPFISADAREAISRGDGSSPSPVPVPALCQEDLQALANKIFIDDAIMLDPINFSGALQHVCWSRGGSEASKIIDFITERIVEYIMVNTGTNLEYRNYFRVLSEILMGAAVDPSVAFTNCIPELLRKADQLAQRMAPNDAEFLYCLFKLLQRIGLSNPQAHQLVMQWQEWWKRVSYKIAVNKRVRYARPPAENAKPTENIAMSTTTTISASTIDSGIGTALKPQKR